MWLVLRRRFSSPCNCSCLVTVKHIVQNCAVPQQKTGHCILVPQAHERPPSVSYNLDSSSSSQRSGSTSGMLTNVLLLAELFFLYMMNWAVTKKSSIRTPRLPMSQARCLMMKVCLELLSAGRTSMTLNPYVPLPIMARTNNR